METEKIKYDREADLLYMWSIDPEKVEEIITEETGDEVLVKKDADTGKVVGVAVLHFSSRQDSRKGIDIDQKVQHA